MRLPWYLKSLAQALTEEQTAVGEELRQLVTQVDHAKKVIMTQQRYGSVHGVNESFAVEQLVDDAIAMNSDSLQKNGIVLERQFDPLPTIVADRHQVLQILVNMISNAVHACSEETTKQKDNWIIIRLYSDDKKYVKIEVKDNGMGIAPENLSRIFQHGFTTRSFGHGFGLHSGALAAKQLGGTLTAQSAGIGYGASFTLSLPLFKQEAS
nr:ATP-binding protein [uncultured Desulfobacter sp.]